MQIEKVEFSNMIGKFQKLLAVPPVTASFSYAVAQTLDYFRMHRETTLERLGTHECERFESLCSEYLREIRDNGYTQWKSGRLRDEEWLNVAGKPTHFGRMTSEDWDALKSE